MNKLMTSQHTYTHTHKHTHTHTNQTQVLPSRLAAARVRCGEVPRGEVR